jgi:hypothetical protein
MALIAFELCLSTARSWIVSSKTMLEICYWIQSGLSGGYGWYVPSVFIRLRWGRHVGSWRVGNDPLFWRLEPPLPCSGLPGLVLGRASPGIKVLKEVLQRLVNISGNLADKPFGSDVLCRFRLRRSLLFVYTLLRNPDWCGWG